MPEYRRRYEAEDTAPALKDITHRLSGKLGPKHIKDRQQCGKRVIQKTNHLELSLGGWSDRGRLPRGSSVEVRI